MKDSLGGSMVFLLPDRLNPSKKKEKETSQTMNPPAEASDPSANGSVPSGSAVSVSRSKNRPKKAPELGSVERRNWLVHLHYVRGEYDECLKLTKELLAETRGMCEYANYVQALILRHQGKIHESLELFQLCNVLNPKSVQNLKQMARSLFLLGRHNRALEAYKLAENNSEKPDWEIHYNLGICHQRLGQLEAAKTQLQQALQMHRHHETFRALANVYLQQGDVTAAVSTFRAAIEQFPENSDLHGSLGRLLLQTGRSQQAFEQLGAALTFNPNHSPSLLAAGAMMQSHQDFDVALSKYRVAAQVIPESPALWNNIAMCFYGKKKYVAAISCLKRANYLAPFEWRVLYNLGLVHLTMQQTTSAFHFLSAAVNLKPTKGQIFMLLAVTLSQLEDESNARLAYKQCVTLETKDPTVCLNFAIFLLRQGDKAEALKMYSQFEARVLKIRQNVELDSQLLEAGRRLAIELGQDSSSLTQKPGRHRQPSRDATRAMDDSVVEGSGPEEAEGQDEVSRARDDSQDLLALPPRTDIEEPNEPEEGEMPDESGELQETEAPRREDEAEDDVQEPSIAVPVTAQSRLDAEEDDDGIVDDDGDGPSIEDDV
ncbi:Tetratricopeptide repeat [Trinorchestia longiramus]|nr:Tetratricopeptide repeat [Trinorchestia longiramus]